METTAYIILGFRVFSFQRIFQDGDVEGGAVPRSRASLRQRCEFGKPIPPGGSLKGLHELSVSCLSWRRRRSLGVVPKEPNMTSGLLSVENT